MAASKTSCGYRKAGRGLSWTQRAHGPPILGAIAGCIKKSINITH